MAQAISTASKEDSKHQSVTREKISAFVVCKNEEAHIGLCLQSLSFCDEVIVVDSYSSDRTVEICNSFNVKLIQREWPGYKAQKEFASQQVANDWLLFIDADEYISGALREEIESILEGRSMYKLEEHSGFYVNRVMFFLGIWWRKGGWYPEYRLRFFRNKSAKWVGRDPHENVIVDGKTAKLEHELYHFSYEDIPDQLKKLASHAFARATEDFKAGKTVGMYDFTLRPVSRFLKFYFFKKGFKEGKAAFIVGVMEAFYTFLKYARLWELKKQADGMKIEPRTLEDLKEIEVNSNDLGRSK